MEDALSLMEEKGKHVTKEENEFLYKQVEELKRSNAALQAEIDMFERFISSLDPQDLVPHAGVDYQGAAGASQLDGAGRGRRLRSRSNISDRLQQLTLEQKVYVAQNVIETIQGDQRKLKQRNALIHDKYKASFEEAKLRVAEIRKARSQFEHRLKSMKDNKLDIVNEPEKVLQHIQDKSKVTRLEQLNLKIQALTVHEKKLQQQLQQKKKMATPEYKGIFEEYSEQTTVKNLDELKVQNLKVQRVLSSHKEKLQKVTLESTELSNDIANRRQMLAKIEEEIKHAEKDCSKAKALNQHLRRQIADYQAPDITEYMRVKDKHRKLKQSIHTWERKMALKTQTKAWSAQRATRTPADRAEAGSGSGSGVQYIPTKLPHIAEHRSEEKRFIKIPTQCCVSYHH